MHLRLHTRYQNSAGQRVRIVLNLKRVAYEYVPIVTPRDASYQRLNPQGLMPALEIDGRVVAQSMAIIELLEELFPHPSIYPADPIERAETRAFAYLIAADLHPVNNQRVRKYLAEKFRADEAAQLAWYQHWVAVTFTSLETQLQQRGGDGPYCFGAVPTLADACLAPQMANARRFGCDLSAYPRLVAIDAACRQLQAFADAAPEAQPDYPGEAARA